MNLGFCFRKVERKETGMAAFQKKMTVGPFKATQLGPTERHKKPPLSRKALAAGQLLGFLDEFIDLFWFRRCFQKEEKPADDRPREVRDREM